MAAVVFCQSTSLSLCLSVALTHMICTINDGKQEKNNFFFNFSKVCMIEVIAHESKRECAQFPFCCFYLFICLLRIIFCFVLVYILFVFISRFFYTYVIHFLSQSIFKCLYTSYFSEFFG